MEFFFTVLLFVCGLILVTGSVILVWQLFGSVEDMLEARKRKQYRELPRPVIRHTL